MKFTIKRDYLEVLLAKAMTISDSAAISTALKSVMLEVQKFEDGSPHLNILRTDSILSAVVHTDKFVLDEDKEPYRVLVFASNLMTLISNLESDMVTFEVPDDFTVKIASGKYVAEWVAIPSKKFPELPRFLDGKMHSIDAKTFIRSIERVKHAVSVDSVKPGLKQVFFDEDGVWAYNDNVYQQVCIERKEPLKLSIPATALDVVKFVRLSGVDKVSIQTTEDFCAFMAGDDIFLANTMNVPPPIVGFLKKINPKRQAVFVVEVGQLAKILKRIGITSNRKLIEMELKSRQMVISSHDGLDSVSTESLPITYKGDVKVQKKFKIDYQYLLDALSAASEKTVWMKVDEQLVLLEDKDSKAIIAMSQVK